eukprot:1182893-Prorocentrum_minimum.AAC.3
MPAHVKSTLVGASFSVPVNRGSLQLGTWQGIYLCEHRDVGGFGVGHERDVTLTLPTAEISVQKQVTVTAPSRGCHDITAEVLKAASGEVSKLKVYKHTNPSVCLHQPGHDNLSKSRLVASPSPPPSPHTDTHEHTHMNTH